MIGNDCRSASSSQKMFGRGSLPAIRVGKQPYGVLLTRLSPVQINEAADGEDFSFLKQSMTYSRK
jgi:hypothetical protein